MSRHVLRSDGNTTTFVGWDNPLQTFFAQTFVDYDTPQEEMTWNVGDKFGEFPEPDGFTKYLEGEKGFEVPYGICALLNMDFAARKGLSPLQQHMKEMFDKMFEEMEKGDS